MTVEIVIGWWLLPTAISIILFAIYGSWQLRQPKAYGYGGIGQALAEALVLLITLLAVALVWVMYLTVRVVAG